MKDVKKYDELSGADKDKVGAFLTATRLASNKTDLNFILSFAYLIFMSTIGLSTSIIGAMLTIRSLGLGLDMIIAGMYFVAIGIGFFIFLVIASLLIKEKMSKELYLMFGIKSLAKDIFEMEKSDLRNLKWNWRKVVKEDGSTKRTGNE